MMTRYHYIKEHLPTGKRWVRTVECRDHAAFMVDLNVWNEASLTWKFWQPSNEHLTLRGIDIFTLHVWREQRISVSCNQQPNKGVSDEQTTEKTTEVGRDHRDR